MTGALSMFTPCCSHWTLYMIGYIYVNKYYRNIQKQEYPKSDIALMQIWPPAQLLHLCVSGHIPSTCKNACLPNKELHCEKIKAFKWYPLKICVTLKTDALLVLFLVKYLTEPAFPILRKKVLVLGRLHQSIKEGWGYSGSSVGGLKTSNLLSRNQVICVSK